MYFWHSLHWTLWSSTDDFLARSAPGTYIRFLSTSLARAQVQQGWPAGSAWWGKMSSPSGVSAPGEIKELLIWQQPHPLVFTEYFYRAALASTSPPAAQQQVLQDCLPAVNATANWMAGERGPTRPRTSTILARRCTPSRKIPLPMPP